MGETRQISGYGAVEFPDSMSKADIDAAEKRLVRQSSGTGASALYRGIAGPVTGALASGLETLGRDPLSDLLGLKAAPGYPPDVLSEKAGAAARAIVPQTLPQAGGLAGTIGGALLTGGASLPVQAAARVGGAFLGGGGGGLLEGQSPMEALGEAGLQGGAAAGGEIGGWAGGKLLRGGPGGQSAINRQDLDRMMTWFEARVPALKGQIPRDPSKLKQFVQSAEMKRVLGDAYDDALSGVSGQIGNNAITVPSLSPQPMPFQEAAKHLRQIGQKGYSGTADNPLTRRLAGDEARQLRQTVLGEIEQQLNLFNPTGEAVQAFKKARHEWAVGHAGEMLLRPQQAWKGQPNAVALDMNAVRGLFESRQFPKLARDLGMTQDEMESIITVLYRGGAYGSRDLLSPGGGRFGSHLGQMARGRAAGSVNIGMAPLRGLLPGLGDEYTGMAPLALGRGSQTALDALLQAAGGSSLNPLGLR